MRRSRPCTSVPRGKCSRWIGTATTRLRPPSPASTTVGCSEQGRARQVDETASIDTRIGAERQPQHVAVAGDRVERRPHPEGETLKGRAEMRGIRLRRGPGGELAEIGIGAFGIMAGESRADQAGEGDQRPAR